MLTPEEKINGLFGMGAIALIYGLIAVPFYDNIPMKIIGIAFIVYGVYALKQAWRWNKSIKK